MTNSLSFKNSHTLLIPPSHFTFGQISAAHMFVRFTFKFPSFSLVCDDIWLRLVFASSQTTPRELKACFLFTHVYHSDFVFFFTFCFPFFFHNLAFRSWPIHWLLLATLAKTIHSLSPLRTLRSIEQIHRHTHIRAS